MYQRKMEKTEGGIEVTKYVFQLEQRKPLNSTAVTTKKKRHDINPTIHDKLMDPL